MSSLTFRPENKEAPIAQILEIEDDEVVEETPIFLSQEQPEEISNTLSQTLAPATIDVLSRKFKAGVTLEQVMDSFTKVQVHNREIRTRDYDIMQFLPSYPGTERAFIAGRSRSGKSTVIADYGVNYMKFFPDRKIILFCRTGNDPAFKVLEQFNFAEYSLDREDVEEQDKTLDDVLEEIKSLSIRKLANSLVIFDDCDNHTDQRVYKAVKRVQDDIFSNGAKHNIHVITVNHQMYDGQKTKLVLAEANKVVFFPGAGTYQIENFLTRYAGMKPKEAEKWANLRSRWVMISMNIPRYIVSQNRITLI